MAAHEQGEDSPLPEELARELEGRGVVDWGEVALRRELERHVPGYNLFRLTPAATRRWKCRYRVLLEAGYYDGQSAAEAYGRALVAVLTAGDPQGAASQGRRGAE